MRLLLSGLLLLLAVEANALSVKMNLTKNGKSIGDVELIETKYGVLIRPHLTDVPAGIHGFHLHANPSCGQQGKAAGGHFDPDKTDRHLGPYYQGHLGDLPALTASADGNITLSVLAPRLTLKDFHGHALILHAGGDNYADKPLQLGGGGARYACGIVKVKMDKQLQKVLLQFKHAPVIQ